MRSGGLLKPKGWNSTEPAFARRSTGSEWGSINSYRVSGTQWGGDLFKRIVVGTDGSPTAKLAVERALQLAHLAGAEVHLVSAHRPIEVHLGTAGHSGQTGSGGVPAVVSTDVDVADSLFRAAAAGKAMDVKTQTHPVKGKAAAAILAVADTVRADLIVVGSVGADRRLLASVPRTVTQRAHCDVLIVHTT